jgi:hypothetical protein
MITGAVLDEELDAVCWRRAEELAALPRDSFRAAKLAMTRSFERRFGQ